MKSQYKNKIKWSRNKTFQHENFKTKKFDCRVIQSGLFQKKTLWWIKGCKKLVHYLKKILRDFKNKSINNELFTACIQILVSVFLDFHNHFTQEDFPNSIRGWFGVFLQWWRMENFAGKGFFLLCGWNLKSSEFDHWNLFQS